MNIQLQIGPVEEGIASMEQAVTMAPPDSHAALNLVCAGGAAEEKGDPSEAPTPWNGWKTAYEDRDPLLPFVASGVVS